MSHPHGSTTSFLVDSLAMTLLRDGYVLLRDLLPRTLAHQVAQECDAWFETDCQARRAHQSVVEWIDAEETGLTRLDLLRGRHIGLRAWERSPAVFALLAALLDDGKVLSSLEAFLGAHFVINDCMLRRQLIGQADGSRYELHRDTPYEFGIGVFLEDVGPGEGGTAIVPGSQFMPIPFRRLRSPATNDAVEMVGRGGDVYLFLGEAFHGVAATSGGNAARILLVGCHPGPAYFGPDPLNRLKPPAAEVLEALKPQLRSVFRREAATEDAPGPLYALIYDIRERLSAAHRILDPMLTDSADLI